MFSKLLAAWCGFWTGILLALFVFVTMLSLSGCAASRPAAPPTLIIDQAQVQHLDSLTLRNWLPLDPSALAVPAYLVPAPAGSSPHQRRQWQRAQAQNLARAGVLPAKVKNSSVATAPGATSINRPASTVATGTGTVATDARKAGKGHGASAVGPGAVATATSSGPRWWVFLLVAVLGAVVWEYVSHQVPLLSYLPWRTIKR